MATRTIASPAVWSVGNNVFVALQGDGANCPPDKTGKGLVALKIRVDPAPAIETAWCATVAGNRGSPIVTTTNGGANPIVFIVGAEGDDRLYAFRGDTGELIASPPEHLRGFHRYQTLIAAGDRLYVASGGQVYACTRKCADRMSAFRGKATTSARCEYFRLWTPTGPRDIATCDVSDRQAARLDKLL
jgi:hypothetical protein